MPNGPLKGLKSVGPTNSVEQELADLYNQQLHSDHYRAVNEWVPNGPDRIIPPQPPGFRQDTLTPPHVGPYSDEEAPWDFLYRIAPNLRGISPSIQVGPTAGVVESLIRSGYGPGDFGRVNLLGSTNITGNKIALNPSIAGAPEGNYRFSSPERLRREFDTTTAHELYHAAGHEDEDRAMNNIEGLMTMAREYQRRQR